MTTLSTCRTPLRSCRTASSLAGRNLEHVRQIPEKLLDVTLQPLMFVLLFAYVFGGVIDVPGGNYREYLIGGILVQTLAFGMMGPAISIATDLSEGDRRPLPLAADVALGVPARPLRWPSWPASLLGDRDPDARPASSSAGASTPTSLHALGGFALLVLFAAAMIWLGTLLGVIVRSPDAVQGIAFMVVFPLTFLANAFVPIAGLPDGLRQFAEWNPISAVVAARARRCSATRRRPRPTRRGRSSIP